MDCDYSFFKNNDRQDKYMYSENKCSDEASNVDGSSWLGEMDNGEGM